MKSDLCIKAIWSHSMDILQMIHRFWAKSNELIKFLAFQLSSHCLNVFELACSWIARRMKYVKCKSADKPVEIIMTVKDLQRYKFAFSCVVGTAYEASAALHFRSFMFSTWFERNVHFRSDFIYCFIAYFNSNESQLIRMLNCIASNTLTSVYESV